MTNVSRVWDFQDNEDYMDKKLKIIVDKLQDLLGNDTSGHDVAHVMRVYHMALRFCRDIPSSNPYMVALVALLHDCDDRKLFGDRAAHELPNATKFMHMAGISANDVSHVQNIIRSISFNKRVAGQMPITINGKIVADADMCDAIGATGIARCIQFGTAKGLPFFNPNMLPREFIGDQYAKSGATSPTINHFFEKLLKIKDYCLTAPGQTEAAKRHQIMIDFLGNYFTENNAPYQWHNMLNKYRSR